MRTMSKGTPPAYASASGWTDNHFLSPQASMTRCARFACYAHKLMRIAYCLLELQNTHQPLQHPADTGPSEPESPPDVSQRANVGFRKATDQARKEADGSQKAEQESVVRYAKDLALDEQGFVCGEVVQKQLQMMSVCFEGLCHEVRPPTHLLTPGAGVHALPRGLEAAAARHVMLALAQASYELATATSIVGLFHLYCQAVVGTNAGHSITNAGHAITNVSVLEPTLIGSHCVILR